MASRPRRHRPVTSIADFRRASQQRRLLIRYRVGGEASARDELIEHYIPLAYQLARRYANDREPLEDLMQVAVVGLIKAIDGFDLRRGIAFSTYAVPTIQGEIRHHLRDSTWTVHVPQRMQELAIRIERAITEVQARLGRPPTVEEVAKECSTTIGRVSEAREAATAREIISLDSEPNPRDEGPEQTNADSQAFEQQEYELIEHMLTLEPVIKALSERQREVLRLRFVDDFSQQEIAQHLGISQMHVSRLLQRSIERLQVVAGAGQQ